MGAVHLVPSTTFSNPTEREQYDSSNAVHMTLRELERWIGREIAGHYHQRIHAGLHRPPLLFGASKRSGSIFRPPM
jgi:putative transposase